MITEVLPLVLMFVMHRKNFGEEGTEETLDYHDVTLSSA
jgi:hypothetical protein